MKSVAYASLCAALMASSLPPAAAQFPYPPAQRPVEPKPAPRIKLPPIPPGVPTTAENVHLPTEGEVKIGREGMQEVEKQFKVLASGPYYERLQRVSADVVKSLSRPDITAEYRKVYRLPKPNDHSKRVPFEFSFKVLDTTREVNAFSLAGGPVYVTKGLMDYAPSDHELAAVLAHECSHVAFHHVEQLVKKDKKARTRQLFGLLATVIAGVAGGGAALPAASNLMMASELVSIATLNGYGRELESEADRIGVKALQGTQYSPVGMLTFMQKLARDDRLHGNPDAGIFQSHPFTNERVVALRSELESAGYAIDAGSQRKVSGSFRVEAVPQRRDGRDIAELRLNGNVLFTVAAGEGSLTPMERARKLAEQLDSLFMDNLAFGDVNQSPDKTAVLLKGAPVLRVYPEDAAVLGSPAAVTEQAYKEIIRALWREKLILQN
jgi:Zn-dependent protease with chaperone function